MLDKHIEEHLDLLVYNASVSKSAAEKLREYEGADMLVKHITSGIIDRSNDTIRVIGGLKELIISKK